MSESPKNTMSMLANRSLLFILMLIGLSYRASSQDMIVTLLSGETNIYPIEDIRSVKFPVNDMQINLNNGTVISIPLGNILSYHFDLGLSALSNPADESVQGLRIYPNPTSDRVQIEYRGKKSSSVTIDILDVSGKLLERLYAGAHDGATTVEWRPRASSISPGHYLCRVQAGDTLVSGKIIVQ